MASLKQLSNEWYLATSLYDAIEDENIRAITSLVQEKNANANVIIPDYGYTPLHLAVGHENENFGQEVTKLLMKNGGDANVTGIDGVTPLHVAVAWNRSIVVRLLLSYGANPWIKDDNEKDAFDYAHEQQAWETLKALETLKHSKYEDKSYKIKLDKVIIHSNDVQAEYRPFHDPCLETTFRKKQSVSTQTSRPFVRSPSADADKSNSPDGFETNSSGASRGFDSRYDWCDKSEGILITDECKRTIFRHRARSSTFEYSPRRSAINTVAVNEAKINETKKRFFPPVCCVANDLSLTDDSLTKDPAEIEEREAASSSVATNTKSGYEYEGAFSEDSLMTDDQSSDSKSTSRGLNLSTVAKDFPYIDETTTINEASHEGRSVAFEPIKAVTIANPECMQVVASDAVPKEAVKHVTWPGCLSTCACIPSHEEDDSFTVYSNSQENAKKSTALSGIETLPDETEFTIRHRLNEDDRLGTETPTANISLEYKITDDDDGVEFIATRMPFTHR